MKSPRAGRFHLGLIGLILHDVHCLYYSVITVIVYLFSSGKLDLAAFNCINSIILAHFNPLAGHKLASALADYNIARDCNLPIRKLYAQALGLGIAA